MLMLIGTAQTEAGGTAESVTDGNTAEVSSAGLGVPRDRISAAS